MTVDEAMAKIKLTKRKTPEREKATLELQQAIAQAETKQEKPKVPKVTE